MLKKPLGHRAYLISAVVALALPVVIGALAAIDFDKAFEIFHGIFFPGKTNWTFNPYYDQIITVMPEEFFMNCAIIIGVGLAAFAAALIVTDVIMTKREKKTSAAAETVTEVGADGTAEEQKQVTAEQTAEAQTVATGDNVEEAQAEVTADNLQENVQVGVDLSDKK